MLPTIIKGPTRRVLCFAVFLAGTAVATADAAAIRDWRLPVQNAEVVLQGQLLVLGLRRSASTCLVAETPRPPLTCEMLATRPLPGHRG